VRRPAPRAPRAAPGSAPAYRGLRGADRGPRAGRRGRRRGWRRWRGEGGRRRRRQGVRGQRRRSDADPAAHPAEREAPHLPRPPRRRVLRQPRGRRARDPRHRPAEQDRRQAAQAGQALRPQDAPGAPRLRAHHDDRRRRPGRQRQVPHAHAQQAHQPLLQGGAQGQGDPPARHPAGPVGLLRGDDPARAVAQEARRGPRARPGVADAQRREARHGDRVGDRTRAQRHERVARPARGEEQPPAEARGHPPVHARHDREPPAAEDPPEPRDHAQRRRLRHPGAEAREVRRLHEGRSQEVPQRLQALLQGGHQPHDAQAGHGDEAAAGLRRLRV
ncbi:MAG: hypothetical protein AVDCRST_MAG30-4272, partial [uncultured Solirubrobacteraceae bacterium]